MQWISTVLGIAGVAASVLFGVLAAVPDKPKGWVVGGAIVVGGVALLWLLIVSVPRIFDWWPRRRDRKRLHLKKLSRADQENSPSQIHDDRYGFEVIYATVGLREADGNPDPNKWARIKRTRGSATYIEHGYPLEVHKCRGTIYLVGFVNQQHKRIVSGTDGGKITLWMRRSWEAPSIVDIPLERVEDEGSRGDGTWRNPWKLELKLRAAAQAPGVRPTKRDV